MDAFRIAGSIGLALLVGCVDVPAADWPDDDAGSDDDASAADESDGTETGEGTCADGDCVSVPDGWQGPMVAVRTTDQPVCPGHYPSAVGDDFMSGITAAPADCDCTCGPAEGECGGLQVAITEHPSCDGFDPQLNVPMPLQCQSLGTVAPDQRIEAEILPPDDAACSPMFATEFPDPTWDKNVRLCESLELGACEDGAACFVPYGDPPRREVCIHAPGERQCPAAFPDRELLHTGIEEQRGCSDCECGDPTDVACTATVQTSTQECAYLSQEFATGTCAQHVQPPTSIRYKDPQLSGTCAPIGGEPVGDVKLKGTTTLCCVTP